MNDLSHQQLLREYVERRSEAAFADLVRRHLDFVYSAALRMVRDPHLAEDVTQSAFLALAQNARELIDRPVLLGWLHGTVQNLACNAIRSEVRRRAREREAATMNPAVSIGPDLMWEDIAPHLDAALRELSETDRDALLSRYFEHKSAREIAQAFGISNEAAQKRVTRAVERLREFLVKRGVTVTANGLVVLIGANAVQAAPAVLATTISMFAAHSGPALSAASVTVTAQKAIIMTTLQKAIFATVFTAAIGTAVYETARNASLRGRVKTLEQQQAPLTEQIQQLRRERDDAANQLAALQENQSGGELLRLRSEVGRLRDAVNRAMRAEAEVAELKAGRQVSGTGGASDTTSSALMAYLGEAVPPPPNLDAAYTKDGLLNAIHQAAQLANVSLKKLEIESSEFPFLAGVVCDSAGDFEKVLTQLTNLPGYEYRGSSGGEGIYALNVTPYDKLAPDVFQRVHRRTPLRTQIFYHQLAPR